MDPMTVRVGEKGARHIAPWGRSVGLVCSTLLAACSGRPQGDNGNAADTRPSTTGVSATTIDGTTEVLDVGPGSTCGDGVPEAGMYCFESIELPEIRQPSRWVEADLLGDGHPVIAMHHNPNPSGTGLGEMMVVRWGGTGLEVIAGHPEGLSGGLSGIVGRPLGSGPLELLRIQHYHHIGRFRVEADSIYETELAELPGHGGVDVLAAIDVNGDGAHELIVSVSEGDYLYPYVLQRGANSIWGPMGDRLPIRAFGIIAATTTDLDSDGVLELIVAYGFDLMDEGYHPDRYSIVVFRSDGAGLIQVWEGPAGTIPAQLSVADLDHDGVSDLIVRGYRNVALMRGMGGAAFEEPRLLALDAYGLPAEENGRVNEVWPGDFDGDGRFDLVASLRRGDGLDERELVVITDALTTPSSILLATHAAAHHAVMDLNDDGVDDVLAARRDEGGSTWYQTIHLSNP